MGLPDASPLTGVDLDQTSGSGASLHGHWLVIARIVWVTLVALSLGLFITASVLYAPQLSVPDNVLHTYLIHLDPALSGFITFSFHLFLLWNRSLGLILVLTSISSVIWITVGLVVFWRAWGNSNDWMTLFVSFGLITLGVAFSPQFSFMYLLTDQRAPWRMLFLIVNVLGWSSVGLFFYLFPNGRFVPRWMAWLALCVLAFEVSQSLPSNSPFSAQHWPPLLLALVVVALEFSPMYAQYYRYRHLSSLVERQQAKWVVFGIVLSSLAMAVLFLPPLFFQSLTQPGLQRSFYAFISACIYLLVLNMLPLTVGIAVLRYRLWDIDLIINRTLVYGILTISIVTTYILVVVGLGMLLQAQGNPGIALLATGLVAVLFQPLRTWLQRIVNRLIYGERDDPYRVLSWLGQRLEATLAPDLVLPTIVETVALALKLPYTAITLKQGEVFKTAATYGTPLGELLHLPLIYQNEQVGELLLAPRAPGEFFTSADRKLLADLAHQAGAAAHAVRLADDLKQLTIDLQHSRERLVTAREEERRRLRRDLHDGLGPQLAGLTLKLETARNRLAHDALADSLLSDLTTRTQATVADIRRLVYALRPPALDELGLLPALREQVFHMTRQNGGPTLAVGLDNGLSIDLLVPDNLPELPAAVEVAVYRIVQEALTNVVRHAHARHCTVCLTLDDGVGRLTVEVKDDGQGITPEAKKGVGLNSMRERAEELGGTCAVEPVSTGGTCVLVQLPYRSSTAPDRMERQVGALLPEEDD